MSNTARVDSIDALRQFRVSLIKFVEEANAALGGAESEMQRMMGWLDREQLSYWQLQIRKRTEALGRAQEALRMKKLFPDASGRTPTPIEEEKMVRRCKAALEEAEQKLLNVKKYSRVLQREIMNYKGGVQRFATWVGSEIPVAISRLDKMAGMLDRYVALNMGVGAAPVRDASAGAFGAGASDLPAVSRPPAEGAPAEGETSTALSDPRFPILTASQVAVLHTDAATGAELTASGAPFRGEGEKYAVFETAAEARDYAAQKTREDPKMECVLFDAQGRRAGPIAVAQ
jgi:hypothetical protein